MTLASRLKDRIRRLEQERADARELAARAMEKLSDKQLSELRRELVGGGEDSGAPAD